MWEKTAVKSTDDVLSKIESLLDTQSGQATIEAVLALIREHKQSLTDTDIVNWLEQQTVKSWTGISIDTFKEGTDPRQYRFMRHHYLGDGAGSLRECLRKEIRLAHR